MVALGEHGLPVPYAVAQNRHAVLMSLVDAVPLVQVGSVFQLTADVRHNLCCFFVLCCMSPTRQRACSPR